MYTHIMNMALWLWCSLYSGVMESKKRGASGQANFTKGDFVKDTE